MGAGKWRTHGGWRDPPLGTHKCLVTHSRAHFHSLTLPPTHSTHSLARSTTHSLTPPPRHHTHSLPLTAHSQTKPPTQSHAAWRALFTQPHHHSRTHTPREGGLGARASCPTHPVRCNPQHSPSPALLSAGSAAMSPPSTNTTNCCQAPPAPWLPLSAVPSLRRSIHSLLPESWSAHETRAHTRTVKKKIAS
jgi:hypothetical protein